MKHMVLYTTSGPRRTVPPFRKGISFWRRGGILLRECEVVKSINPVSPLRVTRHSWSDQKFMSSGNHLELFPSKDHEDMRQTTYTKKNKRTWTCNVVRWPIRFPDKQNMHAKRSCAYQVINICVKMWVIKSHQLRCDKIIQGIKHNFKLWFN